ncbi:dihydropteroate synthase [Colwelliaceae bacterium 6471]
MGILNVTPDSFSDGGKYSELDNALFQAEKMIADGASIIDIGGESTRPGALEVNLSEELNRTIPVIEAIKKRFDVNVSIDTSKAQVMAEAIANKVDLINDVCALQNDGCMDVVAQTQIPVCIMHMQGQPRTMQSNPQYDDVINDISEFFTQRILSCERAGIDKNRLILDPGFGFGKSIKQNYQLLAGLSQFKSFGLPLLAGLSRKSMIGNLLNREVDERLAGSLSTALIAAQQGANIIRVHDVKETLDAIKVLHAVETANN